MLTFRPNQLPILFVMGCMVMLQELVSANYHGNKISVPFSHVLTKRENLWDSLQKILMTKNLIVDQYIDTKNTLNDIYNTVTEQFSDMDAPKSEAQPVPTAVKLINSGNDTGDTHLTTKTEGYKISRNELGRILGRNLRGIERLAQTEFIDALNATRFNLRKYKAEVGQQFDNSFALEQKSKLKSVNGLSQSF